jgi:GT2 family glycosyltransferase
MPDNPLTISAVVVSYNTRQMTLDCLTSLYADLGTLPAEVFVVDNASTDGSVDAIRAHFPYVHIIANAKNVGFGAANNQAMKLARGEFILLLNSDAFPKPGAIPTLVETLRMRPDVGVVGPRLLNRDGSLQVSCFKFPSPGRAWLENLWLSTLFSRHPVIGDYRRWPHDTLKEVEWAIGACLLVRRTLVEQIGGFDEIFFMYAEESDWQLRMSRAGWRILFTPAAQVTHLGGASGQAEKAKISEQFFRSLDFYERKHHGFLGLLALRVAMIFGCSARFLLWCLLFCLKPGKRALATSKIRMHAWLAWRQLTRWTIPAGGHAPVVLPRASPEAV